MLRPGGYGVTFTPNGVQEADTFTCKHCSKIVTVKPLCDPADLGGLCKCCMGLICPQCYDAVMKGAGCKTWEKVVEEYEARERLLANL